jgi:3-mercaptopyruvate sulfurtransferase SseA
LSQLESRFDELPRDKDLVVACQGGGRSLKATYFLMYRGFERVANMQGGILKWASKGFPVRGSAAQTPEASANAGCDCSEETSSASGCCSPESTSAANTCC